MKCPHCDKPIEDSWIVQAAGSINGKKGQKGGKRKGAGRPRKLRADLPELPE